jgi:uncharacterized protein YciI
MMLIVELEYLKPLEEVEKHLVAHRDFLQIYYDNGTFIASGPKDPRTGGIIIAATNKDNMQTIIEQDPFYIHGIGKYSITCFDPVKICPQLKELVNNDKT